MIPLIYNPASAGGHGEVKFQQAKAALALHDIHVEGIESLHPGHAIELAKDLADHGAELILAVGGDGTHSEVANGVLRAANSPILGFLPGGTGNDFLRDFGVTDIHEAAKRIAAGTARAVDAGKVSWLGGEHFTINVFGIAFAAQVADRTNRKYKWMGSLGYSAAVIREVLSLKANRTRIVIDQEEHQLETPFVAVCNTIHTGGAMKMAPAAKTDDGELDLLQLEPVGRVELLMNLFPKIFKGTHVHHPKVHFFRGKQFELEPEIPTPLLIDGEVMGQTPVNVDVIPKAFQLLV